MSRIWTWTAALGLATISVLAQDAGRMSADIFKGLAFRSIGPSLTTGRIADVAVDAKNPSVWYVASASGNLWKTVNRGNTWTPIFDSYGSYSLGVVVVDPRDSNVVWLGTGENKNQRSVGFGDGVYKSTDAGATWTRTGLENSEHLGKIVIDPRSSNTVFVAAIGPLWAPGGDRGVYRTTDGGQTWKAVLTIGPDTGVQDIVQDPKRPDTLYASAYQRRRAVGQLIGGGPESGIYKTTDGGTKWTKLSKGLPEGDMGKIGLEIDPRDTSRIYALIAGQADRGGFFRSDDGGASWRKMGTYQGGDPGYYHEIFVDPRTPDTIWSPQTQMMVSRDGGATFERAGFEATGMHVDHHEIVFDPADSKHLIVGNDGGLYESWDDGETWRHFTNLPLSQFYRVAVDNARPFYNVCGGTQDNGTHCGPSRTMNSAGIRTSDWFVTGGGDGFQPRMDPEDPNIFYASSQEGNLMRLDLRVGRGQSIRPRAPSVPTPPEQGASGAAAGRGGGSAGEQGGPGGQASRGRQSGGRGVGRWHWDAPYIVSPHAPRRLYYGGERLWRTDDRGDSWTPVSTDLTRNLDPRKVPIMGKIWPEDSVQFNRATTRLSTITALDESPLLEGLIYVGTDDGLIQITEDGGKNWRKVERFPTVAEYAYVTDVFASPREVDTVFATFNDWQRGNFKPYVLKSTDRGRTWTSITGNLPERSGAWSIVQDHVNGSLLFAGLEFGVYFTVDAGQQWTQLKGGLPTSMARDLHIQRRESDLVVGTFGRGAFILDDYSPLRAVTSGTLTSPAALLPLRPAYQYNQLNQQRAVWGNATTPNPPYGAVFTYYVGEAPVDATLAITIADDAGRQVRRFEVPKEPGIQRAAWNLTAEPPRETEETPQGRAGQAGRGGDQAGRGGGRGSGRGGTPQGPPVPPGRYRATLGRHAGETFTPLGDPQTFMVVAVSK
ncbi:MAG TPA: hypothetical protein VFO14_05135 [Vicinamibacterales bacterium]|nr:hypothetical protein [Vicinamibacterales bacterium]